MARKAIFLDRDGVINKNRDDYVKSIEEFVLLPHSAAAIKLMNQLGYIVVVITNQSAVNRGLIALKVLNDIHNHMIMELIKKGARISGIYHCPHRPDENCVCRKPKPGLILEAIRDFDLDAKQSIMIGDRKSDIEAATSAGLESILMQTDGNLLEVFKERTIVMSNISIKYD